MTDQSPLIGFQGYPYTDWGNTVASDAATKLLKPLWHGTLRLFNTSFQHLAEARQWRLPATMISLLNDRSMSAWPLRDTRHLLDCLSAVTTRKQSLAIEGSPPDLA
ncbi:hypothetical protein [Pseudomonas sp. PDM11]|uniref:hypothetical protein n=1 Tax=Pseudomonas sp. PDM11 TaxID=2769309 RepID=UPI001781C187|nr:hypothetical protein [Pseudomonas sp. PDM11]MBD9398903.1 hypothetical protein [Pseudomonas sp. PDM11]